MITIEKPQPAPAAEETVSRHTSQYIFVKAVAADGRDPAHVLLRPPDSKRHLLAARVDAPTLKLLEGLNPGATIEAVMEQDEEREDYASELLRFRAA